MEDDDLGNELAAERGRPSTEWLERTGLLLHGRATDRIWAMTAPDGLIGLCLDSGEAGTVFLNKEQAGAVITTLQQMLQP